MKEREFKKFLMESRIDEDIDRRMLDKLLEYEPAADIKKIPEKLLYIIKNNNALRWTSKAAALVLALCVVGAASVWATYLLVETKPVNIQSVTEDELNKWYEEMGIDREESVRKFRESKKTKIFGEDNNLSPIYDDEGNLIEMRKDNGALYRSLTNPPTEKQLSDKRTKDREISEQAFAELGIPNIIPDYMYDNYLIGPSGIILNEYVNNEHGYVSKELMVCFYADKAAPAFSESIGEINESIWFNISNTNDGQIIRDISLIREVEEQGTISSYTNKNGIICTIEDCGDNKSAWINYRSAYLGSGLIVVSFNHVSMERVYEILDMLPLVGDLSYEAVNVQ